MNQHLNTDLSTQFTAHTSQNTICKEGVVRAVSGENIEVEITISSACSECHAKSICMPSDHKQETVTAKSLYGEHFEVGDKVNLVLKSSAGRKAVVIAYLLPLIVFMVALFGSYILFHNELASVLICLTFVVLYFIVLKRKSKKIEGEFEFFVKKKL